MNDKRDISRGVFWARICIHFISYSPIFREKERHYTFVSLTDSCGLNVTCYCWYFVIADREIIIARCFSVVTDITIKTKMYHPRQRERVPGAVLTEVLSESEYLTGIYIPTYSRLGLYLTDRRMKHYKLGITPFKLETVSLLKESYYLK